jgi:hypothetical protein
MPALMFMIAVDWYGPIRSLKEARTTAKRHKVKDLLYVGYETRGQYRSYVGISNDANSRLRTSHKVLGKWPDDTHELWLGIVASQTEAGRSANRKAARHKAALTFAEHMIARFVQTSENVHGSTKLPKRSGALLNRWFHLDAEFTRHKKQPHKNWPDFIEFEKAEKSGRTVFFEKKIKRFVGVSP